MRPRWAGAYSRRMPRVVRSTLDDGVFHITTRGVNRADVYYDTEDRRTFVALFAAALKRYRWEFHTVCLMTNHYHLVLGSTVDRMSEGMQWLNGATPRSSTSAGPARATCSPDASTRSRSQRTTSWSRRA